ncbi:hypothetical protein D3C81_1784210 [compost metagenome]
MSAAMPGRSMPSKEASSPATNANTPMPMSTAPKRIRRMISGPLRPLSDSPSSWAVTLPWDAVGKVLVQNGCSTARNV